jgi:hypothetical protein
VFQCPLGVFQRPVFVWCLRSAHAQPTSPTSFWVPDCETPGWLHVFFCLERTCLRCVRVLVAQGKNEGRKEVSMTWTCMESLEWEVQSNHISILGRRAVRPTCCSNLLRRWQEEARAVLGSSTLQLLLAMSYCRKCGLSITQVVRQSDGPASSRLELFACVRVPSHGR